MKSHLHHLKLESTRAPQFIDITDPVVEKVQSTGVMNGLAVIFSRHTTAAVKINENEPLLLADMEELLERVASREADYRHNRLSLRTSISEDECPNGHAHCQHLFLSTSETVPILDGQLQLGQWQRIFLVELDMPRAREVLIQVLGE